MLLVVVEVSRNERVVVLLLATKESACGTQRVVPEIPERVMVC